MNYNVPPQFLQEQQFDTIERRLTRIETRLCHLMVHLGAGNAVHVETRPAPERKEQIPNRARQGEWK